MKSFAPNQRVLVRTCEGDNGEPVFLGGALGTVARVRRDGGAWVRLDERSEAEGAHPFDDEDRSRHVLAWPNGCEPHRDAAPRTDGEIVWCGSFANFGEWCNKARSWLACDSPAVGRDNPVVCEDTKGRRCNQGSDFMRARDEGAFPVRFGWPAGCVPARYRSRP